MRFNLIKFLNSTRGKYVFSVLLGLGLATLFRKACNSRNCLVFKSPDLNEIKNKIFSHNEKCYEFKEESTTCNNTDNSVNDGNIILEVP